MRLFAKVRLRLRSLFRRSAVDSELDAELRFHLDQLVAENIANGMTPEEARWAARRALGEMTQWREECRDMRRVRLLEDLLQDVRYTVRTLAKSPGFASVVAATLALGIGATTAIFTIVHSVLLRPLPYDNPDQLMYLSAASPLLGSTSSPLSVPEYLEFRQMTRTFSEIGAFATGGSAYTTGEVNLTAGDRALRVRSLSVDADLLRALRIQPEQGRLFRDEETSRWMGTLPPPVAMISHALWQTAFGGQALVGRKVDIEGRPHEIAGILPPGTDVMDNHTQVWLPLWVHPVAARQREAHQLSVIARRKAGVSVEAAQAELQALLANWGDRAGVAAHVPLPHPARPTDHTLQLRTLHEAVVGSSGRTIWVLQAAVGLVMLIVCANLANLVIARAKTRHPEFALRTSLGASRGRLLRQAMTEGMLLAGTGGLLGVWLADASLRALLQAYPDSLPRTSELGIDLPVALAAAAVSGATAILFGFLALGGGTTGDLAATLRAGGRGGSGGLYRHTRHGLVIVQIAFAVMLAVGAGLLMRTVYNLTTTDAGFDRSRLVTFSMTLPMANSDPDTRAAAYQRILEGLRSVPGVLGAAAMSGLPPQRTPDAIATPIEGYVSEDGSPSAVVDYYQFVMGDYFGTMGIPVVAGRSFTTTDNASQGRTAIVNETLARRIWKGQNPIGRRLRPPGGSFGATEDAWHTVIGVAKNVRQQGVEREAGTELYLSLDQHRVSPPSMNVVIRTTLPPTALSATVSRTVAEVDASVPVVRLRDMEAVFSESIRRPRLLAHLLAAFGGLALALAAIGTYGVLSYLVTERRREIGIRIALGAVRSHVLTQVMKQGLQVAAAGIAVGLAGALLLNRLLASLLFGVQPADLTTLGIVTTTIATVAAGASWLPAWRASRVDPNVVLRGE